MVYAYINNGIVEKWIGSKDNLLRSVPSARIVWDESLEDYKKRMKILNSLE